MARMVTSLVVPLFAVSPEKGAETSIYLASSPEVEGITGQYFVDCKPAPIKGQAADLALAKRLWEVSEELVKLVSEAV